MRDGMLIDERGRRWPDRSWELVRRLGRADPDLDLSAFAVRERGFIHIRAQENGARVALRVGGFGLETLAGALYELKERRFPRIILAMLVEGEWFYEMLGGAWEFAERAEHLIAGGPVTLRHPWLAAERDLAALGLAEFAQVQPLVRLWQESRGRLPQDIEAVAAKAGLLHRIILVRRRTRSSSRLVFAHFGAGIEVMLPCQSLSMIERDVHDQPDRGYGAWVEDAYARSSQNSRLRLESVRAVIRPSDDACVEGRYDRLLVPWRDARNEVVVMGISLTRTLLRSLRDDRRQIRQHHRSVHP
jgi:hypothetical protein